MMQPKALSFWQKSKPKAVGLVMLVLIVSTYSSPAFSSHAAAKHYDREWAFDMTGAYVEYNAPPKWFFGSSFSGVDVSYALRVLDAHDSWNRIGQKMQFLWGGHQTESETKAYDYLNCKPWPPPHKKWNGVHWADDIGANARMSGCQKPDTNIYVTFWIQFDPTPTYPWYTGGLSGQDCCIGNRGDFWTAASHEFGHATGWWGCHYRAIDGSYDDYNQNTAPYKDCTHENNKQQTNVCNTSESNIEGYGTMCSRIIGKLRGRNPAPHDVSAFKDKYPNPKPPPPPSGIPCLDGPCEFI